MDKQALTAPPPRTAPQPSWRMQLARAWRARCDRRATSSVLVLGDSHVRVFEHWWFMWALPRVRWDIVYVPGGTASGLYNAGSQSQAYRRFEDALGSRPADRVILNLGEVDNGYTIWARANRTGAQVDRMLADAIDKYTRYILDVARRHRLIVLSAPLPTLPDAFEPTDETTTTRRQVPGTQRERTALTLRFNDAVAQCCRHAGVPYLDDRAQSLGADGIVRARWVRPDAADHHYDRGTYARWLAPRLRPLLQEAA